MIRPWWRRRDERRAALARLQPDSPQPAPPGAGPTVAPSVAPPAGAPLVHLSPREWQIASRVAEGYAYTEIAVEMAWSSASVRQAAHRISTRLPGRGSPVVRIVRWWYASPPNVVSQ